MKMTPCPACDVNIFESFQARAAHVKKCVEHLRDQYIVLLEAVKKVVKFNVHDVQRPLLTYDDEAVQKIWGLLGFPVAQKN